MAKEELEVLNAMNDPNEIVLSTGKRIEIRERKGQHHILEGKLLAACAEPMQGNMPNVGDLILMSEIKVAMSIKSIDGEAVKIPMKLADVFDLADRFQYEEWDELKLAIQPKQELIEAAAKNLQENSGLDNV